LTVRDSEFHGPGSGYAISSPGPGTDLQDATITGCVIAGYSAGILISAVDFVDTENNELKDLKGGGIWAANADGAKLLHNRLEHCGGDFSIDVSSNYVDVEDNTVANSSGSGIYAAGGATGTVAGNVVWGSRLDGIWFGFDGADAAIRNNTCALNQGSGFVSRGTLDSSALNELAGNIAFRNGGYGVKWDLTVVPTRCNDWFENALGATQGLPPSSEDFSLDPLFCAADSGDFHLHANSPLVNMPDCGQVGALGVGCDVASTDGHPPTARFRLTSVGPSPSRGPVRIEFELPEQAAIELDVFDVMGRRVASAARGVWPAGRHAVECFSSEGARVPGGVYLVRYRYPGGVDRRRVVHTR
jgi:parallel beta-helix repeat protein